MRCELQQFLEKGLTCLAEAVAQTSRCANGVHTSGRLVSQMELSTLACAHTPSLFWGTFVHAGLLCTSLAWLLPFDETFLATASRAIVDRLTARQSGVLDLSKVSVVCRQHKEVDWARAVQSNLLF